MCPSHPGPRLGALWLDLKTLAGLSKAGALSKQEGQGQAWRTWRRPFAPSVLSLGEWIEREGRDDHT